LINHGADNELDSFAGKRRGRAWSGYTAMDIQQIIKGVKNG